VPGTDNSDGNWINSRAQVVGTSFKCDASFTTAYLWEQGTIVDLNTLIPSSSALHLFFPIDINDRGEIAGLGTLANGDVHAFLLIPNDRKTSRSKSETRSPAEPRKVTSAEVAVFHSFLAHLHDRQRRHRRL
ncbi:MAG TPA: hypothetical protein VGG70_03305, partial [Candidatus Cybelea sp.]